MILVQLQRADRFRSETKISIRSDYRDELVLEGNFGWYHVNEYKYSVWNRDAAQGGGGTLIYKGR